MRSSPDWQGGPNSVFIREGNSATVRKYDIEQVELPVATKLTGDQEGVFWTTCLLTDQVYTIDANWGGGEASDMVIRGYGSASLNSSGQIEVVWNPDNLTNFLIESRPLIAQVRLINDVDQVGHIQSFPMPFGTYTGPLIPSLNCPAWSRRGGTARASRSPNERGCT